jgi:hypothetical protein
MESSESCPRQVSPSFALAAFQANREIVAWSLVDRSDEPTGFRAATCRPAFLRKIRESNQVLMWH